MARFPSVNYPPQRWGTTTIVFPGSRLMSTARICEPAVALGHPRWIRLFLVHDRGVWEGVKQKRSITGVFATSRTP